MRARFARRVLQVGLVRVTVGIRVRVRVRVKVRVGVGVRVRVRVRVRVNLVLVCRDLAERHEAREPVLLGRLALDVEPLALTLTCPSILEMESRLQGRYTANHDDAPPRLPG